MLPAQIHHLLSQFTGKAKPADGARIEFSGAAHEASLIEMCPYIQKRDHGRKGSGDLAPKFKGLPLDPSRSYREFVT